MRRLRYSVAASLDGFIAGVNGEYDWIVQDPSMDFGALVAGFDTLVMGRKTYALVQQHGLGPLAKMRVFVCSSTLRPEDHPGVTVLNRNVEPVISALKHEPGKDIWLFGGGVLCRTLLDAGLLDSIEVTVSPVLLGEGIPLVAPGRRPPPLKLVESKTFPSGIVTLSYAVQPAEATSRRAKGTRKAR